MQDAIETYEADNDSRRMALNLLAGAPAKTLAGLWDNWAQKPAIHAVRGPEIGLVMVRGRTGGGGSPFNLGEATVTRATVRLESGEIGHGYCLGRDLEKAKLIAVFDALRLRDPASVDELVIAPLREALKDSDARRRQEVAATKVDFFTMVRGDD